MDLFEQISRFVVDAKGAGDGIAANSSVRVFLPELTICATIVLMLMVRIVTIGRFHKAARTYGGSAFWLALLGSLLALVLSAPWKHLSTEAMASPDALTRIEIFTGMLVYDTFTVFIRSVLLLFVVLFVVFTKLSGIPDREDGADIYTMVLGATLGMCLMASANHLLMVFMAIEMASVPSYVLAGLLKGRRTSSEAALKYSVFGAGTAGVMLYGISLIAGVTNTLHLPSLAVELVKLDLPAMINGGEMQTVMVLAVGTLMLMVGLAFKLSAVPFHFWCPDVFEGASAEVNAFLSVASKAAALALLVRVAISLSAIAPGTELPAVSQSEEVALLAVDDVVGSDGDTGDGDTGDDGEEIPAAVLLSKSDAMDCLAPSRGFLSRFIAIMAMVTCTFGNLAAFGQTNIKRLLAYSTIAHAGYMMMALPGLLALAGHDPVAAERAIAGLGVYIFIYLFMNLGAFAVVAFLRNSMRSEEICDYAGLIRQCPWTVIMFSAMLFSLVGLPPLAGFVGKFAVFAGVANAYFVTGESYLMWILIVGSINSAISLFYYLRVVKTMTMDPEPEQRTPFQVPVASVCYITIVSIPTVFLILGWDGINKMAVAAASHLLM
ncbi:MAG: NADH-quinone oxidoreductase subunit N [Pirellulaceae bacterium]|nr:NADH-quinone oxidoreductase subunit N [Planctomycetaceae bacterium]